MIVGEGFGLDGLAEQTRLGCNLAAVPGFTVSPVVANAYEMYQAVAEPGERQPGGDRLPGREALRLQDAARRPVQLHPLDPARRRWPRPCRRTPTAGWKFVNCPFDGQLQRRGQLHAVHAEAAELRGPDRLRQRHPGADPLRRAPGGEPDRLQPDLVDGRRRVHRSASPSGTPAGLGNNVYVRIGFEPLEAAKVVPAVAAVPLRRQEVRRPHVGHWASSPRRRSCCGPPRPRRAARRSPASA